MGHDELAALNRNALLGGRLYRFEKSLLGRSDGSCSAWCHELFENSLQAAGDIKPVDFASVDVYGPRLEEAFHERRSTIIFGRWYEPDATRVYNSAKVSSELDRSHTSVEVVSPDGRVSLWTA